jgi:hypothetical protein
MNISFLRREVATMQRATAAGTKSFEELAKNHNSPIERIHYRQLEYIYESTMAIYKGKVVITEQNLQYFPAKVRVFFAMEG